MTIDILGLVLFCIFQFFFLYNIFEGTLFNLKDFVDINNWKAKGDLDDNLIYGTIIITYLNLFMCFMKGIYSKKTITFFNGAIQSFVISQIVIFVAYITEWYRYDFDIFLSSVFAVVASIILVIIFGIIRLYERIIGERNNYGKLFLRFCIINFILTIAATVVGFVYMLVFYTDGLYGLIFLVYFIPVMIVIEVMGVITGAIVKIFDKRN